MHSHVQTSPTGLTRGSTGLTHTFYFEGDEFEYRHCEVHDNMEMLAQGRHRENAARKRYLNRVPWFPTDYHAMKVFAAKHPKLQKNLDRYRQRLEVRMENVFAEYIAEGGDPQNVEDYKTELRLDGYPV